MTTEGGGIILSERETKKQQWGLTDAQLDRLEAVRAQCVKCEECGGCKGHRTCSQGENFPSVVDAPVGCFSRQLVRSGPWTMYVDDNGNPIPTHAADRRPRKEEG